MLFRKSTTLQRSLLHGHNVNSLIGLFSLYLVMTHCMNTKGVVRVSVGSPF
jgi:hypothetical protein